jgi:hypothetical protein
MFLENLCERLRDTGARYLREQLAAIEERRLPKKAPRLVPPKRTQLIQEMASWFWAMDWAENGPTGDPKLFEGRAKLLSALFAEQKLTVVQSSLQSIESALARVRQPAKPVPLTPKPSLFPSAAEVAASHSGLFRRKKEAAAAATTSSLGVTATTAGPRIKTNGTSSSNSSNNGNRLDFARLRQRHALVQ